MSLRHLVGRKIINDLSFFWSIKHNQKMVKGQDLLRVHRVQPVTLWKNVLPALIASWVFVVFQDFLIFFVPSLFVARREVHFEEEKPAERTSALGGEVELAEVNFPSWFCLRWFFIFGPTKVPFGDYFLFFLGFLSKSKPWFSMCLGCESKPT